MKKALTRKQKESYQCILNYMKEHGYPPTVREFGELIGVKSTSSAFPESSSWSKMDISAESRHRQEQSRFYSEVSA